MKVLIKKVTKGKRKGEFRFVLIGNNGENLSQQESYTQKHNVIDVIEKYFSNFPIEDTTK